MIKTDQNAPVITGTFNAQRFFSTLALIISRRENVNATVTVTVPEEEALEQKKAV